ncbi:MAG: Glu-tRNA(Gln) amidotransferase subunit GatE [Candidatus Hadarchaeales archaeon]
MGLNYEKLGLRAGLEIHQELSGRKLFCRCPSELSETGVKRVVTRKLRPAQSEMGEVDRAALSESLKGKKFRYHVSENSCLVELDCEPPHDVNEEALDTALLVSLMLIAKPVDEIHTMRKIVIDGSNPSGFQRTLLIATNGHAEVDGKRFSIPTICLEEDAARKIGESEESVDYMLDRLGIPLIEIATGPDFSDPETAAKAALYIGSVLRATGKVRRGIGTIRQDINISISGGARQEIKGVQELSLIPEVIKREVSRQMALIRIKEELEKRGIKSAGSDIRDVTHIFLKSRSRVIQKGLEKGGKVLAVLLRGFGGLLGVETQPGRRFGTELSDRARTYGKVGGIFHTDEMPAYGITPEEIEDLKRALSSGDQDAVVFVVAEEERARAALRAVVERAEIAMHGVPEETRRALPDGNTEFTRPLPGAGRMYPETDVPPLPISSSRLRKLSRLLPEKPEKRLERMIREYHMSRELAGRIYISENFETFEKLVRETEADPTLVAVTLEETMVSLRREGVNTSKIHESGLRDALKMVKNGDIAREALPDILRLMAEGLSAEDAVRKLNIALIAREELERIISETVESKTDLIKERGSGAMKPLMGIIMEKVRGRADGRLVKEILEKEIEKTLKLLAVQKQGQ